MKDRYDPGTIDMFNLAEAKRRRDEGKRKADKAEDRRGKWRLKATIIILNSFPKGWKGLAEQFQKVVLDAKHGKPHVPQVWSSLTGALIRQGHFAHTGVRLPCKKTTSHACEGKELIRL